MVRMICHAYSSYSLRRVCLAFQEPVIRSQILEPNSATTQGTTEKSSHYFCLPMTHQQSTFSNPFVEAEEGCRKLARSSSSRETGQSSSALEVWNCYIVRHSVRLIGHLLLFCWGAWTPCTTPRPGLRVFRSAFSFDHVISTLILDVGALYIELVPVPCIRACIMYYCTYLQVKKVWSDVPQRSIGSWSLLPWASCSSLFADLSLRLSLLVPSPD